MKHLKLEAQKRTVAGKQVKKLREEGILPGNVYGKNLTSVAVQVNFPDFATIYKEVGETGLIDLALDGELRPVLIKNIQWNHVKRTPLHAEFYQVNLTEKIKAMVPLEITGDAKAVTEKLGVLLTLMSEIEIEALPEALPDKIEVNVESLANLDDQITIADIKVSEGVEILTEAEQVVARIGEMMKEEVEPVDQSQMPEVIGEAEKAATAAEGAQTEDNKKSDKKEEKK